MCINVEMDLSIYIIVLLKDRGPAMRSSDAYLVRGFPIFRGVSDAVFESVTSRSQIRDAAEGEILLTEGELPQSLFVLLNGLVETYSSYGEKPVTLSFIRPPAAFIVAAVWMNQPQLTSARVTIASRLLVIPSDLVRQTIASDGGFAAAVGLELAIRYRDVLKELKNQRIRSATERLANWLLVEAAVAGSDEFDLEVGRALLAARLGMTGEHLSRAFAQLRECGVSIVGNKVRIDRGKLEVLARPSVLMDGTDI